MAPERPGRVLRSAVLESVVLEVVDLKSAVPTDDIGAMGLDVAPVAKDRHLSDERFASVSARVSRTLGAASDETLDVAVLAVLEDLGSWAGSDCAFCTLVDGAGIVTDESNWCRPGTSVLAPAIGSHLGDIFGSALEFLKIGHPVALDDLDAIELGPEERRMASINDLRAMVVVPVRVAGALLGVVGLHVFGRTRQWEPHTVSSVQLIASILVQAVVRTRQRDAVAQANARARRVARFVPSPLVMFDRAQCVTWVSPSYSATTGRPAAEVLGRPLGALFLADDAELLAQFSTPGQLTVRLLLADGDWRWNELSWQPIDDKGTEEGLTDEAILELRDVHDRQVQADQLRRDADHDALTGALNRHGLERRLEQLAAQGRTIVTAFCDLNGFKRWNDTHGHEAGDRLLRAVVVALATAVRPADLLARLGGDEFLVVIVDPSGRDRAGIEERLEAAVSGLAADDGAGGITAAVGVSGIGPASCAAQQRLDADVEMYRRKRRHAERS